MIMFNIDVNKEGKKFPRLKILSAVTLLLFSQSASACHWYQFECLAQEAWNWAQQAALDAAAEAANIEAEVERLAREAADAVQQDIRYAAQGVRVIEDVVSVLSGENRSSVHGPTRNTPNGATWMTTLPDSRKLSQLLIPGTHDSGTGALHLGISQNMTIPPICIDLLIGTACVPNAIVTSALDLGNSAMQGALVETQYWTIGEQLANGIRFLDIRIGDYTDGTPGYALYHGVFPFPVGDFARDVMTPVNAFLASNPREVVLMSVSDEHTLDKSGFLSSVIKNAANNFYTTAEPWTNLGNVRGKVVLFNRMKNVTQAGGVDWDNPSKRLICIDEGCFATLKTALNIQDNYENKFDCSFNDISAFPYTQGGCDAGEGAKTTSVTNHITASQNDTSGETFYINFATAQMNIKTTATGLDIVGNAKTQNGAILSWLQSHTVNPCTGAIIPMDYPGFAGHLTSNEVLTEMIYGQNVRNNQMTEVCPGNPPIFLTGAALLNYACPKNSPWVCYDEAGYKSCLVNVSEHGYYQSLNPISDAQSSCGNLKLKYDM